MRVNSQAGREAAFLARRQATAGIAQAVTRWREVGREDERLLEIGPCLGRPPLAQQD